MTRRSAKRAAIRAAGLPLWGSDMKPVRGKCLGKVKRRPCGSRWGVVRVSLDFRDPARVDRLAVLECAKCGRHWRRVKAPPIRSAAGYQTVRLDVILPAKANRWFSRGHWHTDGEDAAILVDADLGDVDEAARAHGARLSARLAAADRAKARKAESDAVAVAEFRAAIAKLDAANADRDAEERAAAEREARMA